MMSLIVRIKNALNDQPGRRATKGIPPRVYYKLNEGEIRMKVITFLNEKGGVGKTTLATHIAVGLALRGNRVLMVDADPQANATTAFGVNKQPIFHDLIVRHSPWRDAMLPIPVDVFSNDPIDGKLILVPGDKESRVVPIQISSDTLIRRRFRELVDVMDYIIVDTSPTPSLLHSAIMLASDYVLAPTDCEAFAALDGLVQTIAHTGSIHEQAAQRNITIATLAGIIPNKYRSTTLTHTEVLNHLQQTYGQVVWPPIPLGIVLAQAQLERKFLYQFAPEAKMTSLLWQMVDRIGALDER